MPFSARNFPLDGFQHNFPKRALLLACVAAQPVVQLLGNIFDLDIRHAAKLACRWHAGNIPERGVDSLYI